MRKPALIAVGFHVAIITVYVGASVLLTWPLVLKLGTHIPFNPYTPPDSYPKDLLPGMGDHWVFLWLLWVINQVLTESNGPPFFTTLIFYPRGVDLTLPILFGSGPPLGLSAPLVALLGVVPAYNLLMLAALILTAYATFLLVRQLSQPSAAAFLSGLVFGFSPYQLARVLGHFNLVTTAVWIPLYALFFLRAVQGGRIRHTVGAGLTLALSASNPYYFVFLLVFTAWYAFYHLLRSDRQSASTLLARLLSIGAASTIFSVPTIALTLKADWTNIFTDFPRVSWAIYGADLLAFFIPAAYHPLWGHLVRPLYDAFQSNVTEQTVYVGYLVLALVVVAIVRGLRDYQTRFWLITALLFFGLALGPLLHVNGRNAFGPAGASTAVPLPYAIFGLIPGLGFMRVPSRFAIMLMLVLAVLAGFGTAYLLGSLRKQPLLKTLASVGLCSGALLEFLSAPLPLVDARVPKVYADLAAVPEGTLLDVPLDWRIFKYEYYQTVHHRNLLIGQAPRLALSVDAGYANSIPFVELFKNPHLVTDYRQRHVDPLDVGRFIDFFNLRFIVLHKGYMSRDVHHEVRRFLLDHFPVKRVTDTEDRTLLALDADGRTVQAWDDQGFLLDFDPSRPQFALLHGWSQPERWGSSPGLTVAWADAKESTAWIYIPDVRTLRLDLRVLPFSYPGSPQQKITSFVNRKFLDEITLDKDRWNSHSTIVPPSALVRGINALRFVYRYTASPATVLSGSRDERRLAVAFDFIALRSIRERDHPRSRLETPKQVTSQNWARGGFAPASKSSLARDEKEPVADR